MQNYPPNWSEGLFLRPQHFQSADRYWHELIATSSRLDCGFNYGLFALEINVDALNNQVLEVVRCQARTKDGTLVSFGSGSIERIDLAEKLESDPQFTEMLREKNGILVYLTIPQLKLTRPNVSEHRGTSNGQISRYITINRQFEDESTGDNPQETAVRELNASIQFESDELSGFERIPLFRLRRSQGAQLVLELDPEYVPPCLVTQAVEFLQRNFMEAAYDTLKSRADLLSRQVNDAGITFSTQTAGAVDRLMKLQSINQGLATLHCHSFASGVHPYLAYTALCQIVGHLSVFGNEKRLGEMPHYDHENLFFIFQWVLRRIQQLVEIDDSGMNQVYFKGVGGNRLQVRLQPQWFSRDWQIILGIHCIDFSVDEFLPWLDRRVKWKLADPERVDVIYKSNAAGLRLGNLRQTPASLPTGGGWRFFQIREDDMWGQVEKASAVSLQITPERIVNLNDLVNQKTIILRKGQGTVSVEFAIFAIQG